MADQDSFAAAIAAVLRNTFSPQTQLLDCQQLSAGASQETYRIAYHSPEGDGLVALRRTQPTVGDGSSVGGMALETEADIIRAAGANGIPVPRVIYTLQESDALGHGFLMEWLEGETLGQRIVAADELQDVRGSLARSCGATLGKIHAIDWKTSSLEEKLPLVDPEQLVEETYQGYLALNVPQPMIDYTWRWLLENLPENSRTTLVHGDFRNGNLMVTPEGINAVLDWELAHIGDPLRDLGWLCVNSWRFGNSALPVGGFGQINDLLEGYQETSGIEVAPEALRFWQVFGSFWWAMVTLQMANSWRTGETPSLERPVIGRRSSEAQMDCVNLLIPGPVDLPDPNPDAAQGSQLPMPEELLSGVITFLREEVAPQLDSHNRFLAKVAANSLRIAQREFQHGALAAAGEQQRLARLLGIDGSLDAQREELVLQIRQGMPLDTTGLATHLRQTVALQLFIDQPHYSALTHA